MKIVFIVNPKLIFGLQLIQQYKIPAEYEEYLIKSQIISCVRVGIKINMAIKFNSISKDGNKVQ